MKPILTFFTHLLLLVVLLGVPAAPSSAANINQPYTITDLGAWTPVAINNQRQVVGIGACSYLLENGVLTCHNDPDGKIISARDINEQGQVRFT